MSQQRWRRLLPDSSQLWILAAVLVVIFGGVSFVNVASAKSEALARKRAVQGQLQQLHEQRQLLEAARATHSQTVELQARRYFGFSFAGETKIIGKVAQPAGTATPGPVPAPALTPDDEAVSPPIWQGWWDKAVSTLTNIPNWIK
jgi:hypothetical protein